MAEERDQSRQRYPLVVEPPTGEPPLWIDERDRKGRPVEPTVKQAAGRIWRRVLYYVRRERNDHAEAAEVLEEAVFSVSARLQSEDELALVAGPLRRIATERLEQGAAADAARLTQRLINALPRQDEETVELRNGLWDVAIGSTRPQANPKGLAMARRSYEGCQAALATGYMKNMRYCLELQHGEMMIERNHAFWREIGAGS